MPVAPTYPGVYIEEVPSGVRTLTGVATSITAFLGRALRGPVNEPVTLNSYADFERIFGGLWVESTLGYAVRDFYLNGGSQAIIVRLHNGATAATLSLATISTDPQKQVLPLVAATVGAWGKALRARIDKEVSEDVAARYGLTTNDLFNLTVRDSKTGVIEQFLNLTIKESPRKIDRVLENESRLVRVKPGAALQMPATHSSGQGLWEDDKASTKVAETDKASDGQPLTEADFTGAGKAANKEGLYALEKADLFNILCLPPYNPTNDVDPALMTAAAGYVEARRAILLVDPPSGWSSKEQVKIGMVNIGPKSKNAALFFPRLRQPNPLRDNQFEDFAPCGAVAGVIARTDAQRGIWKAPAGLEASLAGVAQLSVSLTDSENGELNPLGVNCLRIMPAAGAVIWGARTLQGNDRLASEWKYLSVRRMALYIEESLYRGTQWVVFEPNDEPLWAQIRLNLGSFMHGLFRQGAFQGQTPREAYLVKCDKETTTPDDINRGVVNILVGFAPLKPAEFVIIQIQQIAAQAPA